MANHGNARGFLKAIGSGLNPATAERLVAIAKRQIQEQVHGKVYEGKKALPKLLRLSLLSAYLHHGYMQAYRQTRNSAFLQAAWEIEDDYANIVEGSMRYLALTLC